MMFRSIRGNSLKVLKYSTVTSAYLIATRKIINCQQQTSHLNDPPSTAFASFKKDEIRLEEEEQKKKKLKKTRRYYHKVMDAILRVYRTFQLFFIFLPPIITSPLLIFEGKTRHWWRICLVFSLQKAGPAFQKLGQWASTRPDLFGSETREDLEHFHSDVPAEPWSKTLKTLESAGLKEDFFQTINTKPVGAGCIAQVHRAIMKDGTEVAVKIRRHDAVRRITQDMELLETIAYGLESCFPFMKYWAISEVAENISSFLKSQLDLRDEGDHLDHFSKMFKEGPCSNEVAFPTPLYAKEAVLIETFEHGALLSKLLALDQKQRLPSKLRKDMASAGVRSFLEMVIVQNFCHADAHPGNLMIRTTPEFDFENPMKEVKFDKLVYVDAGLVNTLSKEDQINFVALFSAVADGDGEKAANLIIDRARDPQSCVDRKGFVDGMSEIIDQVALDSFRLDKVQIGGVLERVLRLTHRHQVRLEPNFTSLIVSIIVLEGVGRQLDPELDIFRTSLPMLIRAEKMYKHAAMSAAYDAVTQKRRSSRKQTKHV